MIPVHSLSELVLEVRDLAKAEQFYGEVLGFELKRWDPRVTVAEAPGCRIQLRLYGTPGHRGASPCHDHLAALGGAPFSVEPEAIPGIAEHLKTHGLLARGPVDFGEGGVSVFCFDPDTARYAWGHPGHTARYAWGHPAGARPAGSRRPGP